MGDEREPSLARWASLLLGALSAAYGALVELRDCGYAHTPEANGYVETYKTATQMAATIYQRLAVSKEEIVANPELEPLLEAISLVSGECARLSAEAHEQAYIDRQFLEIADQLKQEPLD